VAEALDAVDRCVVHGAELHWSMAETIRAHIADLERQLAEARERLGRPAHQHLAGAHVDGHVKGCLLCAEVKARESLRAQLAAQRERDGRDAERYRWLRDATPCSLTLSRNDGHAINYMTATQWIEQFADDFADDDPAEVERMKATNTIWTLQVYPNTPVGFYRWNGATLDAAIDAALKERRP
jgi:hypothetical protein